MSDVFEEVEESLRQDKASIWWKRYGIFVWILGIGIVAAVAFMEWSNAQKAKRAIAQITAFETARTQLAEGDYAAAEEGLAELAAAEIGISSLAAQLLAQTRYEGNGDIDSAAATLEQSAGIDGPLERIARLKAAYIKSTDMSLAELEEFLGDLPGRPTAIGVMATELIAAKAFSEGDFVRAREEFAYLEVAANAPSGVIRRASDALSVIPVLPNAEPEGSQLPLGPSEDTGAQGASVPDNAALPSEPDGGTDQ